MNKNKRKQMKPRYVLWLIIALCLVFIGVSLKNNGEKLSIQNGISSFVLPDSLSQALSPDVLHGAVCG